MQNWIEQALSQAQGLPGTEAGLSLILTESTQANLRWAANALTTNGQMHQIKAEVVAMATVDGGVATGCLSAPVSSSQELDALVARAAQLASQGTAEADASPLVEGSRDTDFDQPAQAGGIDVFTDLAQGLGRAFTEAGEDHLFFGFAEHTIATTWLGTSTGTRRRAVTRIGRFELNAKHPDMIGSAWVGQASADFTDVDIDALVAQVLTRLSWCENRLDLPAGRYDVVLPGGALADLLIYLYWTMSGRDAREGSTVFSAPEGKTRLGEQLTSLPLRMWSDPQAAGMEVPSFAATGSSAAGLISVFDNGRELGPMSWLEDGRLTNLVETSAEQRATDTPLPPLHWPTDNLLVDAGGDQDIEQLIAGTQRGLLLTCLWYIRPVDPQTLLLTGLTRDGVYLIEDGQVVGMVNNFRWNESPVDLLGRITEVARSEQVLCREWNDWFTLTQMPAVKVTGFNMSTVSRAY